jgi:hypothetical protein
MNNSVLQALAGAAQTINAMADRKRQMDFQEKQLQAQQQQFERTMSLREKEFAVRISAAQAEARTDKANVEMERIKLEKGRLDLQGDYYAKFERESGLMRKARDEADAASMDKYSAYVTLNDLQQYGGQVMGQMEYVLPGTEEHNRLREELLNVQTEMRSRGKYIQSKLLEMEQTPDVLTASEQIDRSILALNSNDPAYAIKEGGAGSYKARPTQGADVTASAQAAATRVASETKPAVDPASGNQWVQAFSQWQMKPGDAQVKQGLLSTTRLLLSRNPTGTRAMVMDAINTLNSKGQTGEAEELRRLVSSVGNFSQ